MLIEPIREDERFHVACLQAAMPELCGFTFKSDAGAPVTGREFIDPVWNGLVRYHSVLAQQRDMTCAAIVERLVKLPDGERRIATFDALEAEAVS